MHHLIKFPAKEKLDYNENIIGNLEKSLSLDSLRAMLLATANEKSLSTEIKTTFLKSFAEGYLLKIDKSENKLMKLYSGLFYFLKDENKNNLEVIQKIQELWEKRNSQDLCLAGAKAEYTNFAMMLLNKLIEIQNKYPSIENRTEVFNFYSWLIAQELFHLDGYLPASHFRNLIGQGLQIKKWEEVEDIIEKYSNFLSPAIRKSTESLAKGILYFSKGDIRKAIPFLN
ncbi:MAG: hypothetical protein AAF696_19470, partial [Bacteroidota bacterium]